jgi:hypothetical protein
VDRAPQLLRRIGRELVEAPEHARELAQRLDVERRVVVDAPLLLHRPDDGLEARNLHARHDAAVHLREPAEGVPGKALVVGAAREALDTVVI